MGVKLPQYSDQNPDAAFLDLMFRNNIKKKQKKFFSKVIYISIDKLEVDLYNDKYKI